jgi:O-antigen biosynthesis protein WbqV
MISTDKAVNPTSLMGLTKRVAECYIQGLGASGNTGATSFSTVRFGNVLGSSGSVIPLFQQQLAKGGPITVTHPEMSRYFMTVPEAVELVLQASTLEGSQNKSAIFVLDMGEPMLIKDLAIQMIKLAGFKPHDDIKIEYTGIRPGEKLFEELFYDNETHDPTFYEGITLANASNIDFASISHTIDKISAAAATHNNPLLLDLLKKQVPEYNPNPELDMEKKAA